MEPWLDVDLSGAYLQGKTAYENAIEQVVAEAALPGVVGVKYAASVGFSGFSTADQARDFLTRTHRVLRTRLPWHRLAVEVVAPELGCGQNTACVRAMRAAYPLVTAAEVTRYLQAVRGVDRIYVASGLFTAEYGKHKITYGGKAVTPSEAQWLGVHARGWGSYGQIASREYSLAQPSGSAARDRKTIAKLIAEQITKPVRQRGIQSITLWGHHLTSGKTGYQLLDAGPLWQALLAQNARRTLSVVVSPGPAGAITDLDQLGQGFQEIFILG
ncbi:hypothetical protein [Nonomuraea sp. NPDC050310]|uniref:hypothetical protein n=1 Tax=Nonomuraea sp. NPDC050310 TaxID=3154935 RepID=UPI0034061DBC